MKKRRTAMYLPYKVCDDKVLVFLQKRSQTAERNPGGLSIFGGGLEPGETNREALNRETQEELGVAPSSKVIEIGNFKDQWSLSRYYADVVKDDFDDIVQVREGECGVWVEVGEAMKLEEVSANTKDVITRLVEKISVYKP